MIRKFQNYSTFSIADDLVVKKDKTVRKSPVHSYLKLSNRNISKKINYNKF